MSTKSSKQTLTSRQHVTSSRMNGTMNVTCAGATASQSIFPTSANFSHCVTRQSAPPFDTRNLVKAAVARKMCNFDESRARVLEPEREKEKVKLLWVRKSSKSMLWHFQSTKFHSSREAVKLASAAALIQHQNIFFSLRLVSFISSVSRSHCSHAIRASHMEIQHTKKYTKNDVTRAVV